MIPHLAPHQIEAVERVLAMLDRQGGALLADEVGLGKSWIAAEVAKRVSMPAEFIVPRALLRQWKTLLDQFELDGELITHDSLHGKTMVPGEGDPGLMVIDEAHRFRNPATNRFRALALRSVGRRLLLVTATPICNRLEDLYTLTRLIASDHALAGRGIPSVQLAFENRCKEWIDVLLRELVVRRSRQVLPGALQFGILQREVIRFSLDCERQIREALLALEFPLIATTAGQAELMRQLLWRRLESSPAALLDSLLRQRRFYHRARESLSQGLQLSRRDYRRIFGNDEDASFFQDVMFREFWSGHGVAPGSTLPLVDAEIARLSTLETLLRDTEDQKCRLLIEMIDRAAPEPVLIFTSAVATARQIFRVLQDKASVGLLSSRLRWLQHHRELTLDQVLDSFRSGKIRILVMTDLGAEGLNLQNAAVVIHYDIPWNPVRIEQRNGRIHRIGQQRDLVRAIFFLPERRSDQVVMRAVASKNRLRHSVLGLSRVPSPESRVNWTGDWGPGTGDFFSPPRIGRLDATAVLFGRLVREKFMTDQWGELLSERYRAGAELVIRQMSTEFLDSSRLSYLAGLLMRELEVSQSSARAVRARTPSPSPLSSTKKSGE